MSKVNWKSVNKRIKQLSDDERAKEFAEFRKGMILLKGVSEKDFHDAGVDRLVDRCATTYSRMHVLVHKDDGDYLEAPAHWRCGYCHSFNHQPETKCQSCGADRSMEKR